nr:venom protein [Lampona murina]
MKTFLFVLVILFPNLSEAAPGCSAKDEAACSSSSESIELNGMTWPETEAALDRECRGLSSLDCYIAYGERCPDSLLSGFVESNKEIRNIYTELCVKENDFRHAYLRNIICLNSESVKENMDCQAQTIGEATNYCSNAEEEKKCVSRKISKICGDESVTVYLKLIKPLAILSNMLCDM